MMVQEVMAASHLNIRPPCMDKTKLMQDNVGGLDGQDGGPDIQLSIEYWPKRWATMRIRFLVRTG